MTATKTTKKTVNKTAKRTGKRVAKSPAVKRRATKASKSGARTASRSSTDAIALLKQDHREMELLFERFEKAGAGARKEKARLVASIIEALSRHAAIEEMLFYPAVRQELPRQASSVLEALEEHHVVKWLLSELDAMDPTAERFDAKVTVLMESVRHHVKEEERELFPEVRAGIGRRQLVELGDELRAAKRAAPTHPHPRGPDTPPGNLVVGSAVAVLDRAKDLGKSAVERVRDEIPAL